MPVTANIVNLNATITQAPAPSALQQSGAALSFGATSQTVGTYAYYTTLAQATAVISGSLGNHVELTAMVTTFFAQSGAPPVGVYILELGIVANSAAGVAALTTWMAANVSATVQPFYAYLVPATWDATSSAAMNTLAGLYTSPTSMTYFFVTIASANLAAYTNKSVVTFVPYATAPTTEFGAAALFYQWIAQSPSIAAPATPMAFRYLYGVTPWQNITAAGASNVATINTILTGYGNIINTGAEGGITTSMLSKGTTMDGNQAMFWYCVDWVLVQAKLNLANAIINGSNSLAPVVYNQQGINTLLAVANQVCNSAVSFGLALTAVTTATPFITYTNANPANYAKGIYGGFACTVTPQLGFESVTFNLAASTFA